MSAKSLHHSGMAGSVDGMVWAIWVEMVVLLICSPFSQACYLSSLWEIFQSMSKPSQCRRYHWRMYSGGGEAGDLGMEMVFDNQSILGFHLHSQGIPKIICCRPRLRTIRSVFSLDWEKRMSVWAFHPIVPLMFVVPSTLYARMGLGRRCREKFALDKRPMSMKFPVAPQSMRMVVSMICVPVANLIWRQIVHSFGKATNTWDKSWEEDVEVTSRIKNPHYLGRRWLWPHLLHHPHSRSSRFEGCLQGICPWW